MEHIEGKDFDIHILEGNEILDFLDRISGGEDKSKFNVGDRVRSKVEPDKYGHLTDMCECPWAGALGFRCVTIQLHETCGGGTLNTKEDRIEHLD